MTLPLVSVIMLTYNQVDFVEDALNSVLDQGYENLQIVVSDDASSDGTAEFVRQCAKQHPGRIIAAFNRDNIGLTRNFNQALSRCSGTYVALLDGDDLFLPAKISSQVAFMEDNPSLAISYHNVEAFDSDSGQRLYLWFDRYPPRTVDARGLVRYGPFLPYPGVMMRRACLPPGGANERIAVGSDWLFWIETLATGDRLAKAFDGVLARYRRHPSNVTKSWDWKYEDALITLALVERRWPEMTGAARQRKAEVCLTHAVHQFARREYRDSLALYGRALRHSAPWFLPPYRLLVRELLFWLKQRGEPDDLLSSLLMRSKKKL
jgi:glycosyltransferase involved in cell wall biosynthesis